MRVPAYEGVIIGLDLAGTTGVCEGCPGEVPVLSVWQLAKEQDTLLDTFARGQRYLLERIAAERYIGGRFYGRGEAASAGLIRVCIEDPIRVPMPGKRNADSHAISFGLYAAIGAVARARGVIVREVGTTTARKRFIGRGTFRKKDNPRNDLGKRLARMMGEALGWKVPNLDAADAGAVWFYFAREWAPEKAPLVEPLFSRLPAFE